MDNLKNAIANRQITDYYGRPRRSIHEVVVIEDLTFPSFSSFSEFCQNWFTKKEGFVGYYKEGQFRDKFENYANGDETYPINVYEVHNIDKDNRVMEHSPICDCIRFKR